MASDVVVSDTVLYKVKRDKPVKLTVTVGEKQVGGTSLWWEGKKLPFNNKCGTVQIGAGGQDLSAKLLECVTVVKDINPSTNRTAVTYRLEGGEATEEFPYSIEVKEDKGLARYEITFMFVCLE